ncbi:MAG: prepilin-type N-terminal cleavage/methylation domain-containing protein [Nitrospirae bacterium]|nr:prepilin-type N-terminal cleavage/methylation domain-containing protein [Nitrospirota bacterium]
MGPTVSCHKRAVAREGQAGVTLIELMAALVILVVGILGLLSLTITSIQANLQNDLRNTAVRMTSQVAEALLAQAIDNVVSGSLAPYDGTNAALLPSYQVYPNPVQTVRGVSQTYAGTWNVTTTSADLKQVTIVHLAPTFARRPSP